MNPNLKHIYKFNIKLISESKIQNVKLKILQELKLLNWQAILQLFAASAY